MGRLTWHHPRVRAGEIAGVVSRMPPEEQAVTINAAIATQQARVKITDRRLRAIFLLVVGVGAYLLHNQSTHFDSFRKAQRQTNDNAIYNCHQLQSGVAQINAFYDRQIELLAKRPDLAPEVKAQLIANYKKSKIRSLRCGQ